MPVIAVGMVYYGGTALAAGAVGWAALAAGTMVVGGAASLIGTATGDKKLEADGMMVGTIGSLGYGALSAGGYSGMPAAKEAGAVAAADKPASGFVESTQGTGGGPQPQAYQPENLLTNNSVGNANAVNTTTTSSNADIAKIFAKHDANLADIAKQNLIAQTASGVAQAYSGYEQSQDAKKTADEMRAEQTRLTERDYANRNNLTEITMPTVTGLPNMYNQARKTGLINAAPTTLQTIKA